MATGRWRRRQSGTSPELLRQRVELRPRLRERHLQSRDVDPCGIRHEDPAPK